MARDDSGQGNHLGAQLPGCTWHFLVFPSSARARAMRSSATDVHQDELCMFNCTDVILFSVTHLLSPTTHF